MKRKSRVFLLYLMETGVGQSAGFTPRACETVEVTQVCCSGTPCDCKVRTREYPAPVAPIYRKFLRAASMTFRRVTRVPAGNQRIITISSRRNAKTALANLATGEFPTEAVGCWEP